MIFPTFFLVFITISSYAADESCSLNTADREEEDAEKCLILLKPDTVNRGLVGELIQRFEKKGFTLLEMKMVQAERSVLEEHYQGRFKHILLSIYRELIIWVKQQIIQDWERHIKKDWERQLKKDWERHINKDWERQLKKDWERHIK